MLLYLKHDTIKWHPGMCLVPGAVMKKTLLVIYIVILFIVMFKIIVPKEAGGAQGKVPAVTAPEQKQSDNKTNDQGEDSPS